MSGYPAKPMVAAGVYDSEEKRGIYVGNLPLSISESSLKDIFAVIGSIHSIKLVGKSTLNAGNNYAFVEYDDPASALAAIQTFNSESRDDRRQPWC